MALRLTPIQQEPRTAFVLAGGASLGALQAGMLHALYERGITPDFLVGTSAGALNAAYVASRPQTPQTAKDLARVWLGLHRQDVFPIHPPTPIGGARNRPSGRGIGRGCGPPSPARTSSRSTRRR